MLETVAWVSLLGLVLCTCAFLWKFGGLLLDLLSDFLDRRKPKKTELPTDVIELRKMVESLQADLAKKPSDVSELIRSRLESIGVLGASNISLLGIRKDATVYCEPCYEVMHAQQPHLFCRPGESVLRAKCKCGREIVRVDFTLEGNKK